MVYRAQETLLGIDRNEDKCALMLPVEKFLRDMGVMEELAGEEVVWFQNQMIELRCE